MVSVQITDLTHEFDERTVFLKLSSTFVGKRLAICGPNGSGKSTLLRIIAGILTPTSGSVEVSVDGNPVRHDQLSLFLGIAAPDIKLYADLTPRENLAFLIRARGLGHAAKRAAEALDVVGLSDRADDAVKELSSGLRQRACLAAAIAHQPTVLLLDEPSTNLDEPGAEMLESLVRSQCERGLVIVATNDAAEAARAEDRLDLGAYR